MCGFSYLEFLVIFFLVDRWIFFLSKGEKFGLYFMCIFVVGYVKVVSVWDMSYCLVGF